MLRLLAGFETPDAGRILVEGEDVTTVEPVHRRFGMVFQHYALFPHLDVGEQRRLRTRVARHEGHGAGGAGRPRADSGGPRRTSSAAASTSSPGASSSGWRSRARWHRSRACCCSTSRSPISTPRCASAPAREIRELIRRVGITTVLVTHEQDEAFDLGDRVAVLRSGRLEQVGTPGRALRRARQPLRGRLRRAIERRARHRARAYAVGDPDRGGGRRVGDRAPGGPPGGAPRPGAVAGEARSTAAG